MGSYLEPTMDTRFSPTLVYRNKHNRGNASSWKHYRKRMLNGSFLNPYLRKYQKNLLKCSLFAFNHMYDHQEGILSLSSVFSSFPHLSIPFWPLPFIFPHLCTGSHQYFNLFFFPHPPSPLPKYIFSLSVFSNPPKTFPLSRNTDVSSLFTSPNSFHLLQFCNSHLLFTHLYSLVTSPYHLMKNE